MNERIAAFAEMCRETGFSESEIAEFVDAANQEHQKQEQLKSGAEMTQNGAFGESPSNQEAIPNRHQEVAVQYEEISNPHQQIPNPHQQIQDEPEKIRPLCNHLFAATPYRAARLCGSPALRDENFCYYHHPSRAGKPPGQASGHVPLGPIAGAKRRRVDRYPPFEIPALVDRPSIQVALSLVASAIAGNRISVRQAGRLIFLLQLASFNLPDPPGLLTELRQSSPISVPDRPFKY